MATSTAGSFSSSQHISFSFYVFLLLTLEITKTVIVLCTIEEPSLQGDHPEVIEEYLKNGHAKCIAFNPRGKLLAAGCMDGRCVIWDFESRGIAKELKDEECSSPINSVCWSRCGNRILLSSADKSLLLWNVKSGDRIKRIVLEHSPLQARLHPRYPNPALCLACPLSRPPMIVDLNTENTTLLKVSLLETEEPTPPSHNRRVEGTTLLSPTPTCFNKYGNLVYVGNSKGEILVINHVNNEVRAMIPISSGWEVRNIVFSRNGQHLLANSNDRVIRIYENLLPLKDEVRALDDLKEKHKGLKAVEKLKAVGSKCLTLIRELQDSTMTVHWKSPCFIGNGQWVAGGSARRGGHQIYIWGVVGEAKILEGPNQKIVDLAWHPVRPVLVSVSSTGTVYIWAKAYTEEWSACFPDFKEIEENQECVR
ncbi:hypothetical protein LR48_Vigan08g048900 [Vigna angularis]|uniref:Uncharacterized protein n=1 Tax=Phaseolus angularis TaxID=3914 RepID=A0A0L9V403_PHAAN|nr:hypothetical protein LR48_Vigan08g048900 [Vigna angularis]